MKNSRLSGLIALIVAILLVGGLVYYEFTQNKPQQTVLGNPPDSEDLAPPGDQPIVPPASLTEGGPAAAVGGSMAEAPSTPSATDNTMAAAPANQPGPAAEAPATAAETPVPAGKAPAETAANPPPPAATEQPMAEAPAAGTATPGADNQMAAAPTMDAPAAPAPAAGAPPADQANAAAPPATAPAPTAEQQVATAELPPAAAVPEKPAAPAMAAPPVVPSFDVVRVEPTGEAVVAGQASPGSKVEVLDGAAAVATATANDRGEWAMALDNALKPGTHDLAVRTTSKDGAVATLSDERVAVQVPEPGSKDVLVVLNSPNAPSRVLELPKEPAASGGEQVAAAAPPAAGGTAAQPETPKTGGEVAALEPKSPAPVSPDLVAPAPQPGTTGAAPAASVTPEPAANAPAEKPAAPVVAAEAPPAEPAPPAPEVTVSAVEADTAGTLYVAGTAATGQTVRVYLDDKPLGEAKPSAGGTWLVEVHREVAPGSYSVRADQVSGADGTVVARAEVPFQREIDVASLKASGDTGAASGADVSGQLPQVQTVIIKKGDNLWRIARDTWGRGITWSTLYQANKDQIRNPHWIYPGQVFLMPVSPDVAKQ